MNAPPPVTSGRETLRERLKVFTATPNFASEHDWLWPSHIPAAALTLVAGHFGSGKSFVASDLAARLSAGLPWPGDENGAPEPQPVLLISHEQESGVVNRRMMQAGARLDCVHTSHDVESHNLATGARGSRPFQLPDGLALLETFLVNHRDVRVVIIDSLSYFVEAGGTRNLREAVARLATFASHWRVTIIGTIQFRGEPKPRHELRALGDEVVALLPRAIWGIERESATDDALRQLRPLKLSHEPTTTSLQFDLVDGQVIWSECPEPCRALSDLALPTESGTLRQIDRACEWLRKTLANGDVASNDLATLGEKAGLSWGTIVRGTSEVNVVKRKKRMPDGNGTMATYWSLPLAGGSGEEELCNEPSAPCASCETNCEPLRGGDVPTGRDGAT